MEAEKERQTELAKLRWNASIDMQRLMRGWYARGFADLAKMHRDGATSQLLQPSFVSCFSKSP